MNERKAEAKAENETAKKAKKALTDDAKMDERKAEAAEKKAATKAKGPKAAKAAGLVSV